VLDQLGGTGEGSEGISSLTFADSQSGQDFARAYQDALGASVQSSNAGYYDASMALMLATLVATRDSDDPASVDGVAVRDAMRQINDPDGEVVGAGGDGLKRAIDAIRDGRAINYDGANGPMDFDAQGSVRSNVTRFQIQDGQFLEFERYDCISSDACPRLE
jgi:ABC-type branched-subunit amino acid transport system substrate-binding protein